MTWDYIREEGQFKLAPEGKHRVRIKSVEKSISSAGNDMLVLQFEVSGSTSTIMHYIVFLNDRPEITNRMLTQFFDSFKDIEDGDFDTNHWIGKVGAAQIIHEKNSNGNTYAKIRYFIRADRQDDIEPWINVDGGGVVFDPNELPF